MSLLELFCSVDDYCQNLKITLPVQPLGTGKKTRNRATRLTNSEIMTILIHFHQSGYRNFKHYYCRHVKVVLASEFPKTCDYYRFVALIKRCLLPLLGYLYSRFGVCEGVSFVDSTVLKVCHNRRIDSHRVFAGLSARGKNSMGWFFGFKLHIALNTKGELVGMHLGKGNQDDRDGLREILANPFKQLFGKLIADRGYIGKEFFKELYKKYEVELVTGLKKNMKSMLPQTSENIFFLRKRCIIETIIDQLKNMMQIEHTRHRSFTGFSVNLICGLIAYCLQPNKPSLLSGKDVLLTP
jgi:hypothetical protein